MPYIPDQHIHKTWGGFLKNTLVCWMLSGKSVQPTLWEGPLDATVVKHPLDNGSQIIQWALCVASTCWMLHGGVQWAPVGCYHKASSVRLCQVAPIGRSQKARRPMGASISKRPLDAARKRLVEAFWVEQPVDPL
jgi:hypothetical protein